MKKANEYISGEILDRIGQYSEDVLEAIKQAQIDAIKETAKVCAESAEWTYTDAQWDIPEGVEMVGDSEYGYNYINKQSIFIAADKLKSEL